MSHILVLPDELRVKLNAAYSDATAHSNWYATPCQRKGLKFAGILPRKNSGRDWMPIPNCRS